VRRFPQVTFVPGNSTTPASKLMWSCMDDATWTLDSYTLKPMSPPPHHAVEGDEINYQDYSLVITGDVFRWMLNYAPLETLQRVGFHQLFPCKKNLTSLSRCW
jgi:cation-transporting ATPase 13A2